MKSKVIIFPTDTVYGIGTSIYDFEGIEKIYKIKSRSHLKQLPVLVHSPSEIEKFAVFDLKARLLANRFWPGGLTLILKTNSDYYKLTGEATIGVRIPNHKLALKILEENGPMKTTSVNDSGEPPMNEYKDIYLKYKDLVDYIYDNDEKIQELSSTVVDLTNDFKIIREGNIKEIDISNVLKSL